MSIILTLVVETKEQDEITTVRESRVVTDTLESWSATVPSRDSLYRNYEVILTYRDGHSEIIQVGKKSSSYVKELRDGNHRIVEVETTTRVEVIVDGVVLVREA